MGSIQETLTSERNDENKSDVQSRGRFYNQPSIQFHREDSTRPVNKKIGFIRPLKAIS